MREQIEVVYENGVFQPVGPLPGQLQEHQHLTVTIELARAPDDWLADADPTVTLEEVRRALAKVRGTLAEAVRTEREERRS
jgi:predicted DNA-binding antitoxin AbrB/MazE fold protein